MLRAIGGTMIVPSTELAELLQGYRRFREQGWKPERERWATLRESQEPRVMVIACSDSRVDPAQIFDVRPGEIFVVRNVAALVPPFETTPATTASRPRSNSPCRCSRCARSWSWATACAAAARRADQELLGTEPGEGGFIADWIEMLDDGASRSRASSAPPAARRAGDGAGRGQGQPRQPALVPVRAREGKRAS
jgi:carbonic anhydrase